MVKEILEVGFSPPEEVEADDTKADAILEVLREKGVSFPSEICGETDISKETVYRKLRFLEKQGIVERLPLGSSKFVPDWLKPRIKELWERKLKGDAIRRISWYRVVNVDGKSKKDSAKSG